MNRKQFFAKCAPHFPDAMEALITFRSHLDDICRRSVGKHLDPFSKLTGLGKASLDLTSFQFPDRIPRTPQGQYVAGVRLKLKKENRYILWLYLVYYQDELGKPFGYWLYYQVGPRNVSKRPNFYSDFEQAFLQRFPRGRWVCDRDEGMPCLGIKITSEEFSRLETLFNRLCAAATRILNDVRLSRYY